MDKKFLETWQSDRSFFTSGHLKIIACLTMFLSHLAQSYLLYILGYIRIADLSMLIGRVAMPIYCFMVAQGMLLTKDKKSYLKRLFIFALVSEIPYDLAFRNTIFEYYNQNVIFTLFLGALLIYIWQVIENKSYKVYIKISLMLIIAILFCFLAQMMFTDYSYKGIIAISLLYLSFSNKYLTALVLFLSFYFEAYVTGYSLYIPFIVYLSIPLILLYNGKRGKYSKYGFYLFYPGHLMLIYFLKLVLL